jgi:ribosome-associated protein YbcJ (S4-like RNA binding protein)
MPRNFGSRLVDGKIEEKKKKKISKKDKKIIHQSKVEFE